MDELLVLLQAKLDEAKSKSNINADIDKLQNQLDKLKVQAELDPKTTQKLADDIGQLINQKIVISNIIVNQSNLSKTGQQIGKVISDSAEKAIGNVTSKNIGKYFRVSKSDSSQFQVEMEKLVSGWTNGKGKVTDINIQTRTSYDKDAGENIERLHQATVTYKNELDEVIKKTVAWRQIGTTINANGEEEALRGFVEVAGQYSKSMDIANAKVDTFVEKQKNAVASAQNSLATIESKLHDKGANKTLANTDFNANGLNNQINAVKSAIDSLDNASRDTFAQAQRDVDREINTLNNLISTLKNAEYAATSLRTKDVATVKIDESNKLDAFVQKMEQSGHYTDELKQSVSNLRNQLNGIFNKNDVDKLTSYLNGFSNLQTRFKAVDEAAKTVEKSTKLKTNIDSEKKILQVYTTELKEAGVLTGDVKTKIQEMFHSLSKVDSQNGLTTWRAELKGIKAETDAVLKSVTQLSQKKIDEIQLSMTDKSEPKDNYNLQIEKQIAQLKSLGLTDDEVTAKTKVLTDAHAELKQVIESTNYNSVNEKNQAILSADEKRTAALNQVKNAYEQAKIAYDKYMQPVSNEKATSLINRINSFLTKNTKITNEAKVALQGYADELGRGVNLSRWNEINGILKKTENSMRGLHRLGASLKDQISQAAQSFSQWLSVSSVVMFAVSKTKNAISELKEINTYLTEISKANDKLSKSDLNEIGNNSFDIASKYGKKSTNYLSGVQEASRAGYENADGIAELSVAAQGAGDMTDELANKYIIATDKAYKFGGSVEKLTEVLDGSNYITNHNAVNMTELAESMSIVGSTAASFGVDVDEATAALGTMIATTQQSGSEVARAFKAILLNIRQVSDEEEGIDAEGLTKYENACNALNVKLKETKDGVLSLRDPMEVLRDLSTEYNKLEESDIRRTDLLSSVGGKLRATQLDALLRQWGTYETMLQQYADGTGSMAVEAEKTANSWEGSMNRLGNTWTDTIENIANSDVIIALINHLNGLLSVINNVTDKLGSLGTIGLGAGIFSGAKNIGKGRISVRIS